MYSKQYILSFIYLSNHYTKNDFTKIVLHKLCAIIHINVYVRLCTLGIPVNVCNNTVARVPRIRTRESDRSAVYTSVRIIGDKR